MSNVSQPEASPGQRYTRGASPPTTTYPVTSVSPDRENRLAEALLQSKTDEEVLVLSHTSELKSLFKTNVALSTRLSNAKESMLTGAVSASVENGETVEQLMSTNSVTEINRILSTLSDKDVQTLKDIPQVHDSITASYLSAEREKSIKRAEDKSPMATAGRQSKSPMATAGRQSKSPSPPIMNSAAPRSILRKKSATPPRLSPIGSEGLTGNPEVDMEIMASSPQAEVERLAAEDEEVMGDTYMQEIMQSEEYKSRVAELGTATPVVYSDRSNNSGVQISKPGKYKFVCSLVSDDISSEEEEAQSRTERWKSSASTKSSAVKSAMLRKSATPPMMKEEMFD